MKTTKKTTPKKTVSHYAYCDPCKGNDGRMTLVEIKLTPKQDRENQFDSIVDAVKKMGMESVWHFSRADLLDLKIQIDEFLTIPKG